MCISCVAGMMQIFLVLYDVFSLMALWNHKGADFQRYWVFGRIFWKVDTKKVKDRLEKFMRTSCQARDSEFILQWKRECCISIDCISIDGASYFKKKTTIVMPETCILPFGQRGAPKMVAKWLRMTDFQKKQPYLQTFYELVRNVTNKK